VTNEELNLEQESVEEQTAPEAEAAEETTDAGDVITAELAASREKYMRLAAEYDNFRKRSAR
jgi:molecular chaperone GrpE